jgi:hypothetical protein
MTIMSAVQALSSAQANEHEQVREAMKAAGYYRAAPAIKYRVQRVVSAWHVFSPNCR